MSHVAAPRRVSVRGLVAGIRAQRIAAHPRVLRLSIREREVFVLVAVGRSNQQIADDLGLTLRTVKAHVGSILAKLGLDSRLRLGLFALAFLLDAGSGRHLPGGEGEGEGGEPGLQPGPDAELRKDPAHVRLDGLFGQAEGVGELAVRHA